MQERSYILRGGCLLDPASGLESEEDLWIVDGRISRGRPPASRPCVDIDARGLVIVPGLIDIHVHFREPGNDEAETLGSGSLAAARGGFTSVVTMPNTAPATDTADKIRHLLRKAAECGKVRILPSGCITKERSGSLVADLEGMAAAGASSFTDDGSTVADDAVMRSAMIRARALGLPVMDHALEAGRLHRGVMHEGRRSAQLGLVGISSAAEYEVVKRDITLCEETGCHLHIQHVSSREAVDLIRAARSRGLPVTGEVTPHHLALTDEDVPAADRTDFKMAPPLRGAEDRAALLAAVADGSLQALATDHAPHRASDKARGFATAPFGVVGLETAVGVTYTCLVRSGRISRMDWLRRWTSGPLAVLGQPPAGLATGAPADLAVLDLESEWTVQSEKFLSNSRNTPFEGSRLVGQSIYTFCAGVLTWNSRS